jgi:hypothetical protein
MLLFSITTKEIIVDNKNSRKQQEFPSSINRRVIRKESNKKRQKNNRSIEKIISVTTRKIDN